MKIVSADLGAIEHFLIEVELLNDDGEYSYFIKMTMKRDQLTHFCISKRKFTEKIDQKICGYFISPRTIRSPFEPKK